MIEVRLKCRDCGQVAEFEARENYPEKSPFNFAGKEGDPDFQVTVGIPLLPGWTCQGLKARCRECFHKDEERRRREYEVRKETERAERSARAQAAIASDGLLTELRAIRDRVTWDGWSDARADLDALLAFLPAPPAAPDRERNGDDAGV